MFRSLFTHYTLTHCVLTHYTPTHSLSQDRLGYVVIMDEGVTRRRSCKYAYTHAALCFIVCPVCLCWLVGWLVDCVSLACLFIN